MKQKRWYSSRWKLAVNVITLIALVSLIYATRDQFGKTVSNFSNINAWMLLFLIPVQLINYHAQTKMYFGLFNIVGNKLSYKFLYKTALELNFVNMVFPSGGVTGISYFGLRMSRNNKITGGKAMLVQTMKLVLIFLSFELLIVLAIISLLALGQVNTTIIITAVCLALVLLASTTTFIYVIGSKSRVDTFFIAITEFFNRTVHLLRHNTPETVNTHWVHQLFQDFHENYLIIKSQRKHLKLPFLWSFIANLTEVLSVYVVFLSFNQEINIGAVILAYAVANIAGLISILPAGAGIYEAIMAGVLATAGVSLAVSLPVIIMYRVLNTLIQVPPGYLLYEGALLKGDLAINNRVIS